MYSNLAVYRLGATRTSATGLGGNSFGRGGNSFGLGATSVIWTRRHHYNLQLSL